jgi:hypothetical protein
MRGLGLEAESARNCMGLPFLVTLSAAKGLSA